MATLVVLLLVAIVALWIFRNQVVKEFIRRANTHLTTPLKVGEVDVAIFGDFPRLTVHLKDVELSGSLPGNHPLFTAKGLSFSFDPVDAWNGKYEVLAMQVDQGLLQLQINRKGESNYRILRDTIRPEDDPLSFDIRTMRLNGTRVKYMDERSANEHELFTSGLEASVSYKDSKYRISTSGKLDVVKIQNQGTRYLEGNSFDTRLSLEFKPDRKSLEVLPSELRIGQSVFRAQGYYDFQQGPRMDLLLEGKNTSIGAILAFLPGDWSKQFASFSSEGDLNFSLQLVGSPDEEPGMAFSVSFGAKNARLQHPEKDLLMTSVNLQGKVSVIGDGSNELSGIEISQSSGILNGNTFNGSFRLKNFSNPWISLDFKGDLQARDLGQFLPDSLITLSEGMIHADVSMKGRVNHMNDGGDKETFISSGSVKFKGFSTLFGNERIKLEKLHGGVNFDGRDLVMEDLSGTVGGTKVSVDGKIMNATALLLGKNERWKVEAVIAAEEIDLEKLLNYRYGIRSNNSFSFTIPSSVQVDVDLDISDLKIRKFKASDFSGNLVIRNQQLALRKTRFLSQGGSVELDAGIVAADGESIGLSADLKTRDVNLDSLFYSFGDFNQSFLTSRHLRGKLTSKASIEASLNKKLELIQKDLVVDMTLLIRQGELNDFEPLLGLSRYLDDSGLRKLRFADLENTIRIQDRTVFIPLMEVRTNLTNIQLSGKHDFDQRIEYHIVAPFTGKRNINRAEAGTAFVEEKGGQSRLYLKITGTTDNYKVSYDGEAVKNKITGQIKEEVKSLRESFKTKPKEKKKKVEISEDEYFDWENPQP